MKYKFRVELIFETDGDFDEVEIKELMLEQWEQSPAFGERDRIVELKVTKSA